MPDQQIQAERPLKMAGVKERLPTRAFERM